MADRWCQASLENSSSLAIQEIRTWLPKIVGALIVPLVGRIIALHV